MANKIALDFKAFVNTLDPDMHDIYELCCILKEDCESSVLYEKTPARDPQNTFITHLPTGAQLLLTPTSAKALRKWLETEKMSGMDAETYYSIEWEREKND